jgi:hypothetical protein
MSDSGIVMPKFMWEHKVRQVGACRCCLGPRGVGGGGLGVCVCVCVWGGGGGGSHGLGFYPMFGQAGPLCCG